MRKTETLPAWAQRARNRRLGRYTEDRIVRWVAAPCPKSRIGAGASSATETPNARDNSSNDNVIAFEARAAS